MLVDWVHPSVRDLMINYLMEHDGERRRFLKSTSPAGIVLALSSAGGEAGERTTPLLRDAKDWECLEHSVKVLLASEAIEGQIALMRGLLSALVDPGSRSIEERTLLIKLIKEALRLALVSWDQSGQRLSTHALATYFSLAAAAGLHPPSPRLAGMWDEAFRKASAADWADDTAIALAVEWLDMCDFLRTNEPRFLRSIQWPRRFKNFASKKAGEIRTRSASVEELDPDEQMSIEYEGNWVDFPVEPGPDEESEIQWLDAAVDAVGKLTMLRLWTGSEAEELLIELEQHKEDREIRRDRYEEDGPREPEVEYDRDDYPRVSRSEVFDIDAFFGDL